MCTKIVHKGETYKTVAIADKLCYNIDKEVPDTETRKP